MRRTAGLAGAAAGREGAMTPSSQEKHEDRPARLSGSTELREEERVATEEDIASRGTNKGGRS